MQHDCPGTSAALGYLTLHLELLCSILGAPVLHESQFLGVHSAVWQAPGFWKRAVDPAHMLMLSALPCDTLTTPFIAGGPSWAMALETSDPQHKNVARHLRPDVVSVYLRSALVCASYYTINFHKILHNHKILLTVGPLLNGAREVLVSVPPTNVHLLQCLVVLRYMK